MVSAIVFLPLAGFLIAGLLGKRFDARVSELVTTAFLFVCCLLSWVVFAQVALAKDALPGSYQLQVLATWITSGNLKVDWSLRVDSLTAVMLVVVTTVSALVHLYSMGYMAEDDSRPRFFAYLSLFTFAMLMLVTSNNLAQMFFGWEGVGLASYLLIGFWYAKPSASAAAIKAFVVNRVGDFGFLLGIALVFWMTQSVTFDAVFAAAPRLVGKTYDLFGGKFDGLTLACLLLFMGAMGKSAQFLLHTWLPDAMEGPTPVSALIHAATMVTAGVFMVARLSPLFELAPDALTVVTMVGAITAIFAATVGLVQNDIKRVIAYSTCSQLGYMFVALGVGAYGAGVFHLFTHAFFKALLFLGAGSVIVAMHHEQDMRRMGGLYKFIPFTFAMMTIGTLALTGFPLTSGYFSKDAIIEAAYAAGLHSGAAMFGFMMTLLAAGLTSFYSWRLVFMTFFGEPGHPSLYGNAAAGAASLSAHVPEPIASDHNAHDLSHGAHGSHGYDLSHAAHGSHGHDHHVPDGHGGHSGHGGHGGDPTPHESPMTMLVPLGVLAIGALFAGGLFHQDFIGHYFQEFWKGAIEPTANNHSNHILHEMHEIPHWVGYAPFVMMVLGFGVAWFMYIARPGTADGLAHAFPNLYRFLLNKWYFDELYDALFVQPAFKIGGLFWKEVDGRIIDGYGPNGVAARVLAGARGLSRAQTGYLYHYAFAMMLGVAAFISFYLFAGAR